MLILYNQYNQYMVKTIRISDNTHAELEKLGTKGETFEEILLKLIKRKQ